MTEESLFMEALARPASERAGFLAQACGEDLALKAAVEALLQAHEHSGNLLDQRRPGPTFPEAPNQPGVTSEYHSSPKAGIVLAGRYTLLEPIGEGGMGEVWVARQNEPVKRKVALKLIKKGMDSKAVLARFEQERQALAVMDHPNIARVLDGGLTESGAPFFVMDLVAGLPLQKYCDAAKMTVKERLELFVDICHAVQHAHQKGIVHRDLKPGNILVTQVEGKPVPKIIDFGVAKAVSGKLTEETLSTQFGAVIGTMEYMAPEQAGLTAQDVDTRADIYSLGVILYELLTGLRPFDSKRLKKAALDEIIRILREEEAPSLSSRLSTDASLPSAAATRQLEPKRLLSIVKGELDWIVQRCLEKERNRRYETANGLARDVLRYLADEPVEARPVSVGYRVRKFVRRNRGMMVAVTAVLFTLLLGLAGTIWGWRQAVAQKEQAARRLSQIEKVNVILGSIFENLDPKEIARKERPLQVILAEKLDKAIAQLEGEAVGDPLVVAAIQVKFGESLKGLGEPDKAIILLEKARETLDNLLGLNNTDTLECMNVLSLAYKDAGKLNQALALSQETLKFREARLGPDDPDTLTSMNNLAGAYEAVGKLELATPLYETLLKKRKATLGADHSDTLTSMNNLAANYHATGKLHEAVSLGEETLKLLKVKRGATHPDTLRTAGNLGEMYRAVGKLELALPLLQETLKLKKAKLGLEHPTTLDCMNYLALAHLTMEKIDLAVPLFEETLTLRKTQLGLEHPDTLISMINLATAYNAAAKPDLALPLFQETLKLHKVKQGPDHPVTLTCMNNLALTYRSAGKLDLALPLLEETLKLTRTKLGADHPETLETMGSLGKLYCEANQGDKAAAVLKEFVAGHRKQSKPDDFQFADMLLAISFELMKCRQHDTAEELIRESLAMFEKKAPDDWRTFLTKSMLGEAVLGQKKYGEAEPLLLKGYEGMKQREKTIPPVVKLRLPQALDRLIQLYTETNKPDEVKKWQAEKDKLPKSETIKK